MSLYVVRASAVALTAATTKTLVQLVPGTKPLRLIELGISFDGVTSTAVPAAVDLLRQTTAGTSSAQTPVAEDERTEACIATARDTITAEPTAGNILRSWYVSPVGGLFVMQFPLGREPVAYTNRLGLRVNAPAVVNASAYLTFEE